MWIDTHCHLDAPEFAADRDAVRARASAAGVGLCVLPAVCRQDWPQVQALAHRHGDVYALGVHPLWALTTPDEDLAALDAALHAARDDPQLVAVGEIGLDFWVPDLCTPAARQRQQWLYREQLRLARRHGLPVLLHVRRSADALLQGLRQIGSHGGIAHAFNGSLVQAQGMQAQGLVLGVGGALTYERASALRRLVQALPDTALVLETDAPDIPPQWLYQTAAARAAGVPQGRNEPAQLPRMAAELAALRGQTLAQVQALQHANTCRVLPRLAAWLARR